MASARSPRLQAAPSHARSFARSAVPLTCCTLAAFAGGALYGGRTALATSSDQNAYRMVDQFARVLVQIENNYVDPVDRSKLAEGAIRGMVEGLDPHSSYMSAEEFSLFTSETEGQFGGVGIEVESRGDQLIVIAPIEGSPAEHAGIRSGDRILAIDGEDVSKTTLDKLVHRMRGAPKSHVKVTVRRQADKDLLTFDLVREIIHVPSVASRTLDGGVAYIRIRQFQEHTHDELLRAAAKLRAENASGFSGIVLDLRSNPGGLVDESAEVADEFVRSPIVVVVNEYTASAAELLAGALQDNKRAVVVGANTFGKGSVQTILDLPGGAGMRLTTARYYTPSGHSVQAEGIEPDVKVELRRDPALAGLSTLHERDLEGHLAAGKRTREPAAPRPTYTEPPKPSPAPSPPEASPDGSSAKDVPKDPTTGTDFALRIAYQALRGTLPPPTPSPAPAR
jgi:carboxyl-terminal processing protease